MGRRIRPLYVDADGQYFPAFNQWERTLLDLEMQNDQFAGWLGNPPRKVSATI